MEQAFVENVWKLQQESCGFLQLGGLTLGVLRKRYRFLDTTDTNSLRELSGSSSSRMGRETLSRVSRALALLFPHSTFLQGVAVADTLEVSVRGVAYVRACACDHWSIGVCVSSL